MVEKRQEIVSEISVKKMSSVGRKEVKKQNICLFSVRMAYKKPAFVHDAFDPSPVVPMWGFA